MPVSLPPSPRPFSVLGLRGRDSCRLDMSRISADFHRGLPVLACQHGVNRVPEFLGLTPERLKPPSLSVHSQLVGTLS